MFRAFYGELVDQVEHNEPASVLLKRIVAERVALGVVEKVKKKKKGRKKKV